MAGIRMPWPSNDGIATKNWSAMRLMESDFRYLLSAGDAHYIYKRKLIKREEARNGKLDSLPNYFGFWAPSRGTLLTTTYRKSATNRMEMQKHQNQFFLLLNLNESQFANSLAQLIQPHRENQVNAFFTSQLSTCHVDNNNDFFLGWIKRFASRCIAWNVPCHMFAHANSHITLGRRLQYVWRFRQ